MNKKVVIDTNVLISAFMFSGMPNQVLQEVIKEKCDLYLSHEILNEFLHVLSRPKFQLTEPQVKLFYEELIHITNIVYPQKKLKIVKVDPSDDILFECALEAGSGFLISGNRHVLNIGHYRTTKVITPREYIDQYCQSK